MREDRFLLGPLVARAFQQYWRWTRGVYLAVEACVIDDAGRTLMVREDENDGWGLPATIARKGESLETAIRRGLRDIAGIEVNTKPELHSFFAGSRDRQTGLYVVRYWRQLSVSNTLKTGFFPLDALPAGLPVTTAERIRRSHEGRTISPV